MAIRGSLNWRPARNAALFATDPAGLRPPNPGGLGRDPRVELGKISVTGDRRDTIEVYLREHVFSDWQTVSVESLERMIGASYDSWYCAIQGIREGQPETRKLVLRREPDSGAVEPYDATREYFALAALHSQGYPVPRVYTMERDPQWFGKPFYVMDFVEGDVISPLALPASIVEDAEERRRMAREAMRLLAELHGMDWRALGFDKFLPVPKGPRDPALNQLRERREMLELHAAHLPPEPLITDGEIWLRANAPETEEFVIVHGDYRLGNCIWQDEKIVAWLDWELVHLGDPLYDLGHFCSQWFRIQTPELMCGLVERDELIGFYEEFSGRRVDRRALHYWETLITYKNAVICLVALGKFAAGKWNSFVGMHGALKASSALLGELPALLSAQEESHQC